MPVKQGVEHTSKFKRLRRRLRLEMWEAVGVLETLWHWTADNAELGDIGKSPREDIAADIGWPLERTAELFDALLETGWLDNHSEHGLVVHNWHKHCAEYIKRRVERAVFKGGSGFVTDNVGQRRTTSDGDGQRPSTQPNPTQPNLYPTQPKKKNAPTRSCASAGAPRGCLGGLGPVFLDKDFENGRGRWVHCGAGGSVVEGIPDAQRSRWTAAYPACDIDAELAKALDWCIENPAKGRKSMYSRFLGSWLKRTQEKGGTRGGTVDDDKPLALSQGWGDE
jgi:hypothetical protein